MPHTANEAASFVTESRFALDKFYEVLEVRRKALGRVNAEIARLIQQEQDEHKWFMDWGQFEDNVNHVFVEYNQRLERMGAKRSALSGGSTRDDHLRALIAVAGATENAIGIAAGAVLQVAKQALSYRFGKKGNIPGSTRMVGSHSVTNVIWEGRNHAMHWEESKPGSQSETILKGLHADGLITYRPDENNAVDILDALGWTTAAEATSEMDCLVAL